MQNIRKIIRANTAKSKKNLIGVAITIGAIGLFASFFMGALIAVGGILIAVFIVAGIGVGTYFLLKKFDDLPDVIT